MVEGRVKPCQRSKFGASIHHHNHHHRRLRSSINHRQPSHTIVPGLVIPRSHSDPRAQAGAVRILPVSSSLYLQTAIDKSHHVKRQLLKQRQARHTTDRQEKHAARRAPSLAGCCPQLLAILYSGYSSKPHISHTAHTTRQQRRYLVCLCFCLHHSPSSLSSPSAVLPATTVSGEHLSVLEEDSQGRLDRDSLIITTPHPYPLIHTT